MINANIKYDLCKPANEYWNPDELKFILSSDNFPLLRMFDELCGWNETKQYGENSITIVCQYNSQIFKLKDLALRLCSLSEDKLRGGIYGDCVVPRSHFADKCRKEDVKNEAYRK
ncbi:hypothetical protein [Limosilactobacillus ingluviei]|uniref:hypothetical protein n=1 Tax=Limosilactobacillus ingluviei TaxID=148604 RepID=UPI0007055840|nr:hypothetical protein [Limosilactobacillus ingluviei]